MPQSVEPSVPDALPGGQMGNRVLGLSAWLHYGQGQTLAHIVEVFNCHLHMKLTPGGLIQKWYRVQEILYPWYEQIHRESLDAAVLHADESGCVRRWQDALVVVFYHAEFDLLYDQPLSRLAGFDDVLHRRIRGHARHRFLGSVQRSRLRCGTCLVHPACANCTIRSNTVWASTAWSQQQM